MAAAALAAGGAQGFGPAEAAAPVGGAERERRAVELVSAPVRIADAAAVGLLRAGDRVDVVAAGAASGGGFGGGGETSKIVARGARVSRVPKADDVPEQGGQSGQGGALVVLSVPRDVAAKLAGAGATSRLAVTVR